MTNVIDCKGLRCPQPVINTKRYFDSIKEGEATIIVDNDVAKTNLSKFAQSNGFKYDIKEEGGLYHVSMKKEASDCKDMKSDSNKLTIVVTTNKLGQGDDQLGALLMKSYLYALSESDKLPTDMIFLNGGVKLTTEGSESIESIKKLQERGVNIANCGTCLDFYGLKDKLLVGEISNMYTIVEKMNSAENTLKI